MTVIESNQWKYLTVTVDNQRGFQKQVMKIMAIGIKTIEELHQDLLPVFFLLFNFRHSEDSALSN